MNEDVLDWDDLSDEDKQRVNEMLQELNDIFRNYKEREDPCEDSTSTE